MTWISSATVLLIVSTGVLAQNGYKYERPDETFNGGGSGPSQQPGRQSARPPSPLAPFPDQGGYPSGRPQGPGFPTPQKTNRGEQRDEYQGSSEPQAPVGRYPGGQQPVQGNGRYPSTQIPNGNGETYPRGQKPGEGYTRGPSRNGGYTPTQKSPGNGGHPDQQRPNQQKPSDQGYPGGSSGNGYGNGSPALQRPNGGNGGYPSGPSKQTGQVPLGVNGAPGPHASSAPSNGGYPGLQRPSEPSGLYPTPSNQGPSGLQGLEEPQGQQGYFGPTRQQKPSGVQGQTGLQGSSAPQRPSGPQGQLTNNAANGYPGRPSTSANVEYPGAPSPGPINGYSGRPGAPSGPSATYPGRPGTPGAEQFAGGLSAEPVFPGAPSGGAPFSGAPGTSSIGGFPSGDGDFDQGKYEEGDYSAIPGEPDVDYPIYSEVFDTSFRCEDQQFPGYYADVDARCQIFHVCANNKTYDFLCPNGTIFHQEHLVCVWWNQFDCSTAPSLYGINENIYDYSIIGTEYAGPGEFQPQGPFIGQESPAGKQDEDDFSSQGPSESGQPTSGAQGPSRHPGGKPQNFPGQGSQRDEGYPGIQGPRGGGTQTAGQFPGPQLPLQSYPNGKPQSQTPRYPSSQISGPQGTGQHSPAQQGYTNGRPDSKTPGYPSPQGPVQYPGQATGQGQQGPGQQFVDSQVYPSGRPDDQAPEFPTSRPNGGYSNGKPSAPGGSYPSPGTPSQQPTREYLPPVSG